MKELTIGALARAAGVRVETIRYYQRRGLLPLPPRPAEGYRKYPPEAILKIRFIKRAQRLGFTLREIQELLALANAEAISCSRMLAVTQRKLAEIERKITALNDIKEVLQELIQKCPGEGGLALCPIWERLERNQVKGGK
ncbi:MAG: MerR family transcriptional regulator [Desulfobaccales bacterium]